MPFKKVGPDKFKSPSGRTWTKAQVAKYYATDGFTKSDPGSRSKVQTGDSPKKKRKK